MTEASDPSQPNQQASQSIVASASQTSPQANLQPATGGEPPSRSSDPVKESSEGKQTHRIFGVVPNFAAVTANSQLPPLTVKGKFKLASEDSFDYSSFIWTGMLAAQSMALKTYPEFGHGTAAYGRYYWHGFVDGVSGTYLTEAIGQPLRAKTRDIIRLDMVGFSGDWATRFRVAS